MPKIRLELDLKKLNLDLKNSAVFTYVWVESMIGELLVWRVWKNGNAAVVGGERLTVIEWTG